MTERRILAISDSLSLPMSAATQTFAFIARKGAGKTYAAGKLTELLLEQGVQVVVLDTVGNWYGLRIAADGKGKGFDIPVFGGLRGDLPLQASAGELVADVAVETGRSLILDISQFSLADRKRFATAFGERLWKDKKAETHPTPLMLVIEESQLIVPQFSKGSEHMLGIYEEIIRLGRNYGIGVMMISQRPQSVNKEVLNQTECLFALQVNGTQERKALRDWIVYQGMDVNLLNELPSLPIGTAYVWSPQWLGILKKIKIASKKTFDASATPKVGSKVVRRSPAPLDLHEIESRMQATIERAKQEDPRELRKKIAELEYQLKTRPSVEPKVERVEVPVLNGEIRELKQWSDDFAQTFARFADTLSRSAKETEAALALVNGTLSITNAKIQQYTQQPITARTVPQVKIPGAIIYEREMHPKAFEKFVESKDDSKVRLRAGERLILKVLKQWYPREVSSTQLSLLAGHNVSAQSFNTYKSILRKLGFINEIGEYVSITSAGSAYIGEVDTVATDPDSLFEYWSKRLRSGERKLLRAAIDRYPRSVGMQEMRDTLHHLNDQSFNTYLSVLRNNNLIQVDGNTYRASDAFFGNS